ncbi:hypothetical protein DPMN_004308 [Dreissena polymorpha]|uniref:Uncharacterized protein n=1 Tax=Dreissena polymorpha TaxID=45954 RepID=A0A9D4RTG0_DREPO|nr:hypothetical protein DPMN_004308 [Dreissena polymorpha]
MRQILLLGLCLAVVRGVTVSNSSCGSSYLLNGLNDEMALKYDGGQLPQRCSVAISTSQPGAYLCFDENFENISKTLHCHTK